MSDETSSTVGCLVAAASAVVVLLAAGAAVALCIWVAHTEPCASQCADVAGGVDSYLRCLREVGCD